MSSYVVTKESTNEELGFLPAIPAVASAAGAAGGAGAAVDTGKDIVNTVSSIFGGGRSKCSQEDKQRRQEIEQAINTYLTDADKRELVSGMTDRVSPTAKDMAYFYVGEDDCKHKNVGNRHQRFINELPQKIQQRKKEKEQAQQSPVQAAIGGGGIQKYIVPVGVGLGIIVVGAVAMNAMDEDGPRFMSYPAKS